MSIKKVKRFNALRTNKLGGYEMTTNNDKVWSVHLDANNTYSHEILDWVADGNTIPAAD